MGKLPTIKLYQFYRNPWNCSMEGKDLFQDYILRGKFEFNYRAWEFFLHALGTGSSDPALSGEHNPPKKGNKDSIPKGKELDQTPGIHRDCSQHPTNGTWNDSQVFLQIQGIKNQSAVGILAFKYNPFLGEKKTPNKQTPQHVQGFTKGILFPIFHSLKTGSTFRCSLNPIFFYAIKSLLFTFSRDFSLSLVRNRSQKLLPKLPFGVFFVDKNFHGRG